MDIKRFALGARFDLNEDISPEQLWEEVFSVLTTGDVGGMCVYGGMVPVNAYSDSGRCYVCAFADGNLNQMRRVYRKLNEDAGIAMYLNPTQPFIQTNALIRIDTLTYYGKVGRDGVIAGGNEPFYDVRVCKKRGKRSPAGKGIVFLLAMDRVYDMLPPELIIRRLTIAARRHFRGVRILPMPIAYGGPGTVDAVMTSCAGKCRAVTIAGPDKSLIDAYYAVIRGTTAVIELPKAFIDGEGGADSYGLGELIRMALNEGLDEIVIGDLSTALRDNGLGCLRALGAKLIGENGEELADNDISALSAIDIELMHPRIKEARFIMMEQSGRKCVGGMERGGVMLNVSDIVKKLSGPDDPGLLEAVLWITAKPGATALLDAAGFDRRVKNVSLVITGKGKYSPKLTVDEIALRSGAAGVPVVCMVEDGVNGGPGSANIVRARSLKGGDIHDAIGAIDEAAENVFSLIRLGRMIERVSARKSRME